MSRQCLTEEMAKIHETSFVAIGDARKSLYNQIRLLDDKGNEIIKIQHGKAEANLASKANTVWFQEAMKLRAEEVYVTPVEVAANTGQCEVHAAAPVYLNGAVRGSWS